MVPESPTTPSPFAFEVRAVAFSLREARLCVLLTHIPGSHACQIPIARFGPDTTLEEAARNRVQGLTGLRETYQEQLYTYGEPSQGQGVHRISVIYFALLPSASLLPKGKRAAPTEQDAGEPEWFPTGDLPELASGQDEILAYALRRLRYKLEYSAVGFQLLPEVFTLTELQKTYEIVLGEQLDKRNFRRRILEAGIIEPTAVLRGGEGRPARLYRYRADAVAEVKTRRLFP